MIKFNKIKNKNESTFFEIIVDGEPVGTMLKFSLFNEAFNKMETSYDLWIGNFLPHYTHPAEVFSAMRDRAIPMKSFTARAVRVKGGKNTLEHGHATRTRMIRWLEDKFDQ